MPAGGEADRRLHEEKHMSIRFLTISAIVVLISGPASADCSQEIDRVAEATAVRKSTA